MLSTLSTCDSLQFQKVGVETWHKLVLSPNVAPPGESITKPTSDILKLFFSLTTVLLSTVKIAGL